MKENHNHDFNIEAAFSPLTKTSKTPISEKNGDHCINEISIIASGVRGFICIAARLKSGYYQPCKLNENGCPIDKYFSYEEQAKKNSEEFESTVSNPFVLDNLRSK